LTVQRGDFGIRTDRFEETVALSRDVLTIPVTRKTDGLVRFRLADGTTLELCGLIRTSDQITPMPKKHALLSCGRAASNRGGAVYSAHADSERVYRNPLAFARRVSCRTFSWR
jgi:hypothetical protein